MSDGPFVFFFWWFFFFFFLGVFVCFLLVLGVGFFWGFGVEVSGSSSSSLPFAKSVSPPFIFRIFFAPPPRYRTM